MSTFSYQASAPQKFDEAEMSLATILELGQGDIAAGDYRHIDEFLAELDSEPSDQHRWR